MVLGDCHAGRTQLQSTSVDAELTWDLCIKGDHIGAAEPDQAVALTGHVEHCGRASVADTRWSYKVLEGMIRAEFHDH